MSIFGSRLSNLTDKARFLRLWTELAGSQVFLDGIPLPLFFVSAYQINVQIPYETGPSEHRLDVDDPGAGDGAEGVHLDGHGPSGASLVCGGLRQSRARRSAALLTALNSRSESNDHGKHRGHGRGPGGILAKGFNNISATPAQALPALLGAKTAS